MGLQPGEHESRDAAIVGLLLPVIPFGDRECEGPETGNPRGELVCAPEDARCDPPAERRKGLEVPPLPRPAGDVLAEGVNTAFAARGIEDDVLVTMAPMLLHGPDPALHHTPQLVPGEIEAGIHRRPCRERVHRGGKSVLAQYVVGCPVRVETPVVKGEEYRPRWEAPAVTMDEADVLAQRDGMEACGLQ